MATPTDPDARTGAGLGAAPGLDPLAAPGTALLPVGDGVVRHRVTGSGDPLLLDRFTVSFTQAKQAVAF